MQRSAQFIVYLLGVAALGLFLGVRPVNTALGVAAVFAHLIALRHLGLLACRVSARKRND